LHLRGGELPEQRNSVNKFLDAQAFDVYFRRCSVQIFQLASRSVAVGGRRPGLFGTPREWGRGMRLGLARAVVRCATHGHPAI